MTQVVAVIPARWESSRFPGKPLATLQGKFVVQRVYERVTQVFEPESIFIATDDDRISSACELFGAQVLMTSPDCLTGTDRVSQVASQIPAEWFLNIQGDEPFVDPEAIAAILLKINDDPLEIAFNAVAPIDTEEDFRSITVPKVVVDREDRILYLSRSPIPMSKNGGFVKSYRQVGLYAYSRVALNYFGPGHEKTPLESTEDIEILRLVEQGLAVRAVFVKSPGPAIDTPDDLERAKLLIQENRNLL